MKIPELNWKVNEDGWIDETLTYADCGSHEAEWEPTAKLLVQAIPEMLKKLSYYYYPSIQDGKVKFELQAPW